MANVLDVARYVLDQSGPMTAMKLQKLVYYSHAWHLVWDEEPLITSDIQAWANGPVSRSLYSHHRGRFQLTAADIDGDPTRLSDSERDSINAVLGHYGCLSGYELSQLTHAEAPWAEARRGLAPGERGQLSISDAALAEFYGALVQPATDCPTCQ